MPERIDHLSALRAFAVAARAGSFKEAAARLAVSPSAVSHQIRALEAHLGRRLFERRSRAIALTEAGAALLPGVEEGFRSIGIAVRETRSLERPAELRVTAGPGITAKWLAPRAYAFRERYPAIRLEIETSTRVADLARAPFDVAIRFGPGDYPGCDVIRLFGEAFTPLCAPALAATGPHPLGPAENLARHRLLQEEPTLPGTPDWTDWLAAAGLDRGLARGGQRFAQADHAIQAAIDGSGVLLGRLAIAAGDIAAGRLVRPFATVLPSRHAYHFVTDRGRLREGPIRAFRDWISDEVRAAGLP